MHVQFLIASHCCHKSQVEKQNRVSRETAIDFHKAACDVFVTILGAEGVGMGDNKVIKVT